LTTPIIGFSPGMMWNDPRTGFLTPDAQRLLQSFILAMNGAGATLTNDGIQTITNKTIDGNENTLTNIDTDSLKDTTGSGTDVVTGTAGTSGTLGQWDGSGNLVEGPEADGLLTVADALSRYLPRDGSTVIEVPFQLQSYTVATVPTAASYTGCLIYVSNETGGATVAVSNGTNWVRLQDLATVS